MNTLEYILTEFTEIASDSNTLLMYLKTYILSLTLKDLDDNSIKVIKNATIALSRLIEKENWPSKEKKINSVLDDILFCFEGQEWDEKTSLDLIEDIKDILFLKKLGILP